MLDKPYLIYFFVLKKGKLVQGCEHPCHARSWGGPPTLGGEAGGVAQAPLPPAVLLVVLWLQDQGAYLYLEGSHCSSHVITEKSHSFPFRRK